MSAGAGELPHRGPAESGRRPAFRFLDINLESLRLPEDTRALVREAEPLGKVEILADGTPFVRTPAARLGLPYRKPERYPVNSLETARVALRRARLGLHLRQDGTGGDDGVSPVA